jgi:hypothetical protein
MIFYNYNFLIDFLFFLLIIIIHHYLSYYLDYHIQSCSNNLYIDISMNIYYLINNNHNTFFDILISYNYILSYYYYYDLMNNLLSIHLIIISHQLDPLLLHFHQHLDFYYHSFKFFYITLILNFKLISHYYILYHIKYLIVSN